MTKNANHDSESTAEAIIAENAAHEGAPRTASAARAQESWEEFKEKSNLAAEAVIDEVTHPASLGARARRSARRARSFYGAYKPFILGAAALVAAAALYAALKPAPKKAWYKI